MESRIYACIDLKSFFASVECADLGLDPFVERLVVADPERGPGAITLAVTPALKKLGIPSRGRLFQIPRSIDYRIVKPHMKRYMEKSAEIYGIYLKYIDREDIHVYSIDECFFDFTPYLKWYGMTPRQLAQTMMEEVRKQTGIEAAAGLGTNLFLAKVALDITAKQSQDQMGWLDEALFKETIWHHRPITDIWNIGQGIAARLKKYGLEDLYAVAHFDEKVLLRELGANGEFLIDHAHGREPCTIRQIHEYVAKSRSLSSGQILVEPYSAENAFLVLKEMLDSLTLELVEKGLLCKAIGLFVGYAEEALPPLHKSCRLDTLCNSYAELKRAFEWIYWKSIEPRAFVKRITISLDRVVSQGACQLDLFHDAQKQEEEQRIQLAVSQLKKRYGKNAVLRGMSLQEKATARKRNLLIGGHNGE